MVRRLVKFPLRECTDLFRQAILVGALAAFAVKLAFAAPIVYFEKSWNGAQLKDDPSVKFPTQAVTVVGTELRWLNPAASVDRLIEIPVLPANSISSGKDVVARVDFTLENVKPAGLAFTFGTGTSFWYHEGFRVWRNSINDEVRLSTVRIGDFDNDGHIDPYSIDHRSIDPNILAVPNAPTDFSGTLLWRLRDNPANLVTFAAQIASQNRESTNGDYWYRDYPLAFGFWISSLDLNGAVKSLSIRVAQVPEPGGPLLAAMALVALALTHMVAGEKRRRPLNSRIGDSRRLFAGPEHRRREKS